MAVRADGTAGERAGIACIRERENCCIYQVDGIGWNNITGKHVMVESKCKSGPVDMGLCSDGTRFIGSGVNKSQILSRFDLIEHYGGIENVDSYIYFLDNSDQSEHYRKLHELCTEKEIRDLKKHGDGNDKFRLLVKKSDKQKVVIFNYRYLNNFNLTWEEYDKRVNYWGDEDTYCIKYNMKLDSPFSTLKCEIRDMKDGKLYIYAHDEDGLILDKVIPIEFVIGSMKQLLERNDGSFEKAVDDLNYDRNISNWLKYKIYNLNPTHSSR